MDSMNSIAEKPRRLIVSKEGYLGMKCAGAMLVDQIWILRGSSSTIVLCEMKIGGRIQYRVAGKAFIGLSLADYRRY